jgi:hypothetical protein
MIYGTHFFFLEKVPVTLTSCFGLMADSAVVDAALRKSSLISNGKEVALISVLTGGS